MAELLSSTGYKIQTFKRGDTVTGKVTEVSGRAIFINVGGKTEAVIGEKEYETSREYLRNLKVGDEVTGIVISPESDGGQVVLSVRRAIADSRWKIFDKAFVGDEILTVRAKEFTKGGLLVEYDGVYGFVPASQFSKELSDSVDSLVGQELKVKVIEVDRAQNRLVFSERVVSEAGEIAKRKSLMAKFTVGKIYTGKVIGVVPFGAFVEVSTGKGKTKLSLEGLVHISEISWEKVDDVTKHLKEGDETQVKVIGTDDENGKLALSIKQLTDDPWKAMVKKYVLDSNHTGIVVKVMPYGVIVHMDKGIEGLIHASKMPGDVSFKDGEKVNVFVESIDIDKRRLSLGVVLSAKPVGYK